MYQCSVEQNWPIITSNSEILVSYFTLENLFTSKFIILINDFSKNISTGRLKKNEVLLLYDRNTTLNCFCQSTII